EAPAPLPAHRAAPWLDTRSLRAVLIHFKRDAGCRHVPNAYALALFENKSRLSRETNQRAPKQFFSIEFDTQKRASTLPFN
ncbi:MAG: hypothetical protein IJC63_08375, partial [Myxococcaceae bacterium]|nr:hypothetical protein [Myxococcaceae bacterium]